MSEDIYPPCKNDAIRGIVYTHSNVQRDYKYRFDGFTVCDPQREICEYIFITKRYF